MAWLRNRGANSVTIPDGRTVTPTDDVQILLHCANIWDKAYTTLSALLADTTTLQAVINSNNAIDYLVRSTTFSAQNALVPKMTSNTAPSGTVSASTVYQSGYEAYRAFDKGDSTRWSSAANVSNSYLRYDFGTAKRVTAFSLHPIYSVNLFLKSYKIQGSNDASTWTDLYDETLQNTDVGTIKRTFSNSTAYRYYQLLAIDSYHASSFISIIEMQYYDNPEEGFTQDSTAMSYIGLNNYAANTLLADSDWCNAICNSTYFESVLNVKVPTMTSNTTPSGECFGTSNTTTYYNAFDGSTATSLVFGSLPCYVGYKFANSGICLKRFVMYNRNSGGTRRFKTYKIQASTDGNTWEDISPVYTNTITAQDTKFADYVLSNMGKYQYFRAYVTEGCDPRTPNEVNIGYIQFYGREDV